MLRYALATVLCILPATGVAAERCSPARWEAARTPGWDFSEIPLVKTPKAAGCRKYLEPTCEFRDPVLGYVYSLGSMDINDTTRPLWNKDAYRKDGAKRLPFGVSWNDSRAAVMRKLHGLEVTPRGAEIVVFTCWWPPGDGAWTSFEFGRDGKLAVVRQFVQP